MSIFESYEREFGTLMKSISDKIDRVPDLDGDSKKSTIKATEDAIDDAHELIEQMELEVMEFSSSERGPLNKRLAAYKKDVGEAERDLRRAAVAVSGSQAARDALFDFDGTTEDQRAALLDNTDVLDRTSRRLQDGHRMALETQDVAVGIMADLHSQRETIERSRGRLRETDNNLVKSNRLLGRIIQRAIKNKVALAIIIIVALGLMGIIIYLIATKS